MKKKNSLILIAAALIISFAACNGGNDSGTADDTYDARNNTDNTQMQQGQPENSMNNNGMDTFGRNDSTGMNNTSIR